MDSFLKSFEKLRDTLYNLINLDDINISHIKETNNNIEDLIKNYNKLLKPITDYLNTYYKGTFIFKNNIDEIYFENINLFYTIINNLLTILNNIQDIINLNYSKIGYNYKQNLLKIQKQKINEIINQLDLIISGVSILLLNFNELVNRNEEIYKTQS